MKNAWQSRHFEIKDGMVTYYEDQGKKSKPKPRGSLNLTEASLVMYTTYEHAPPFSFSFELVPTGKEEKWRLCANNQTEMTLWCDTLKKYVVEVTDLSSILTKETVHNKEMTGFLLKKRGGTFGSHMKNAWQGRYFEIKNGVMYYYEEEGETSKPRGQMKLNGFEVTLDKNTTNDNSAPSNFTFELIPLPSPGARGSTDEKWRLCATTEQEMNEWCDCIQECLENEGLDEFSIVCEDGNKVDCESSMEINSNNSNAKLVGKNDTINSSTEVHGGDDVVMSLAWQRRSARTMSGVDRVACETVARALELEQGSSQSGHDRGMGSPSTSAMTSALEFDDLELDDDEQEYETSTAPLRVRVNSSGESITIGGDQDGVYVHTDDTTCTDEGNEQTSPATSKSLDVAKKWMSKRKTQLSHIITDINSNNHGRQQDGDKKRPVFLDQEPLETEGTFCV